MELFRSDYQWYKGNLHTHTTVSDGQLTPQACIAEYKRHGYDFMAITDHDRRSEGGWIDGMLTLSGIELAVNQNDVHKAYHFVGLDCEPGVEVNCKGEKNPQAHIDRIKAHGGYCIFGHPCWSLVSPEDLLALNGVDAVEVMNSVSDPGARGDSTNWCDTLMARGLALPLVASDDAHFYNGDHCYSAIWVNSPELSREAIMESIRAGRFYASTGPRFRKITVEDGLISVSATPCACIRFMSDAFYSQHRRKVCDTQANVATYQMTANDNYVRVQLTDFNGRTAWSGYIRNLWK